MLAFSVNETLLLDQGQGIEEMLSISLDPDIAIETYHDYVQIRGIIILQGEYKKSTSPQHPDHEEVMNYLEKIIDTEPGQAMFSHRFPVEISIPKNRIYSISDVRVEVAAFDYELPTVDCLKINATLHIGGISKDEIIEDRHDVMEEPNQIGAESNEQAEAPKAVGPEQEKSIKQQESGEVKAGRTDKADKADKTNKADKKEVAKEPKQSETPVSSTDGKNHAEVANIEVITESEETIDIQLSENVETDEEKVKDVLFLTDLFGGIQEETKTNIRIHITQEEDTVETIAKRYEVSALQLIKENNLSPENLSEGMLIQIPQK